MEIEQPTTERSTSTAFYQWFIVMMLVFSLGIILEGYETKPETRYAPHIWESKGYIIDNQPVLIDENCTHGTD